MSEGEERRRDRLKGALMRLAEESEDRIDGFRSELKSRLGTQGLVAPLPYRGHGNKDRIHFHGRVLENPIQETPTEDDSTMANLAAMYRRFGSKEVPGCQVRVTYGDRKVEVTTDVEGFFSCELEPGVAGEAHEEWQTAAVEVVATPWGVPSPDAQTASSMCPLGSATFGVISDVDDTVLVSDAHKRLTVIMRTALGNATTRLPFQGVATLYGALRGGGDGRSTNPFFYVSSSPWNLYDFLTDFFRINHLPDGPFFLKDLGLGNEAASLSDHEGHKLGTIRAILEAHPSLDFVLMGDSGERDPEIYSTIARSYPGRIKAVVIRDVTKADRDAEVRHIGASLEQEGVPTILAEDSVEAAVALSALNLVASGTAELVRSSMRSDEVTAQNDREDA